MSPDREPLELSFADLFDNLGTDHLGYSAQAAKLSGREVSIEGFLAHAHSHEPSATSLMLVDQPGLCPDCSPVPAAVISLQGAESIEASGERAVRVVGRLDFGFRIDDGVATFIRIEQAAIARLTA